MINVSSWSIRNPTPAILLFAMLTLFGVMAFKAMKIQQFMDIDLPTVTVTASLPGAAPAQMETEVARKIENSVATLQDVKHIYAKIQAGELDGAVGSGNPPADVLQEYATNPDLQPMLKSYLDDRTMYITMNLNVPPFDDIHVRKAANLIMDKAGMQQAWGGDISGLIATHIQPPGMAGLGQEYDPYATPNFAGDEALAKAEMALSAYDTNGDGITDYAHAIYPYPLELNANSSDSVDLAVSVDLAAPANSGARPGACAPAGQPAAQPTSAPVPAITQASSLPREPITYQADEDEPLGGKIVIDLQRCDDCGLCVTACCGQAITIN